MTPTAVMRKVERGAPMVDVRMRIDGVVVTVTMRLGVMSGAVLMDMQRWWCAWAMQTSGYRSRLAEAMVCVYQRDGCSVSAMGVRSAPTSRCDASDVQR